MGLKWTRKTTEKIAAVLQEVGIPVSANTVARLLYQMDFSQRVNRKQIATNSKSLPRSAIPADLLAADSLPATRSSDHQRRQQEARTDRQFQERRSQMGSLARTGERSRLPLTSQRCRHLLLHIRHAAEPRRRLRRHFTRYAGLRRPFHRHLVETRGIASLGPCSEAPGFGGLRRQQQLHFLGLEDRNPGSVVQCIRHHRYDRSLSHRGLQMESHRASSVLRDLQALGRRTPGQL